MAERVVATAKAPEAKQTCSNSSKQKPDFYSSEPTADMILQLQRTAGNRAVQRLIKSGALKAKLRISQPNDIYEQEADLVAEQVMRMPEPQVSNETKSPGKTIANTVQRNCPECKLKEEEEKILQAKEISSSSPQVTPEIESSISTFRNGGQPLPESTRAFFEPRFGKDFSKVRLRTDTNAAESARVVNARAFTVGQTISFGSGQYSPETSTGKRLLAHELTHVVQQGFSETTECSRAVFQRIEEGVTSTKHREKVGGKDNLYPPVNWTIDRAKNRALALPRQGVSLQDVAQFLYGDSTAVLDLASINKISPNTSLLSGLPLQLTGKKLTQAALNHLNASPKIPLEVEDPEAFLAKKRIRDAQLENDFNLIIRKLDEVHYSDSDEGEVIKILRKWAEEKFAENPALYPAGGEYLDKLFTKLTLKTKDIGVVTTQVTSYYSMIFNRFDRVTEVRFIRDVYSRNFKGDNGLKELSFGSYFWEQVKEGKIRDQIFAYFRGLGKGIWSGAKGTVMMAYTLVTDPQKFLNDLKNLPSALRTMWEKRSDLWNKFANTSPEEQAEMIGKVFGEIEFMIGSAAVGGAAAKGVGKLTEIPGTVGKIAKAIQVTTKLPQTALGAVAKGVKTVVVMGVKGVAEGAKFAARGVYRIGKAIFRGTWSVVEKIVGKITKRIYYFFDEGADILREIPAKFAKECVKCRSPCKLTSKAMEVAKSAKGKVEKASFNSKKALAELKERRSQRLLAESKASKRSVIRTRADLRRELQKALDRATPIADRWLENSSSYWAKVYRGELPVPAKFASIPFPRVKAAIRGKVVHNVTEKIVRKMEIPGLRIEKRVIVSPSSGKYRIPDFFFKVGKKEYREFLDIKPKNFNFGPGNAQYDDMAKVIDEWGGEITKLGYD